VEKHDEVTKSDALAATAVSPPAEAPAPRPPSVFGAVVVDAHTVYRVDVAPVPLDDLHEFEEQFTILVRNKLQLERAHRAGLRGRDLAWRTEIHSREIEVAVAKLIELGALQPVPAADEQA
jgi:hypothetical protein